MSVQTLVLFGNRLYDQPTYSTNQDPQALSLVLSDSSTILDTNFQFLADALSLIESAITTDGIKALADSLSMTEQQLLVAVKSLVDNVLVSDSKLTADQIKALTDFIRVKDWIELKWTRVNIWQTTPAFGFRPSTLHKYGPGVYYGKDFYSSNPTVNWLLSTPDLATWRTINSSVKDVTLYERTFYGKKPFSSTPAVGWTPSVNTGQQNWTNADGESHN